MKAIKETGNELLCALDPYDGIGVMDSYYPNADFFTEPERFDRHLDKLRRTVEKKIDYVSICSPNYLHDAHIRMALRNGCHAICEKPLVLNPWNLDALQEIEIETHKKIYTILQLRLHPAIKQLKERVQNGAKDKIYNIDLTYITSRGNWYYTSWKGDVAKSGGVATNIGVHFYDMLAWIFGSVKKSIVHSLSHDRVAGFLNFEKANVRYFLSINYDNLPDDIKRAGKRTFRLMKMDGEELEFSDGFTDLHTESYSQILQGNGFLLGEARTSISIVHDIRNATPVGLIGDYHPLAKLPLTKHPFNRINPDYS